MRQNKMACEVLSDMTTCGMHRGLRRDETNSAHFMGQGGT
jgi:hypothetical protein